jgi:DNA-binding MarR family transcriptional regulator
MKREETVDYHIKAAWHAISRMYNQGTLETGITASSGFVLLNIDSEKGTPATKIAPMMGMEARSLTRMLKNMEDNGWIYKEPDPVDGRSVRIFLTELGKEKRQLSREAVILFNKKVREQVTDSQLENFFTVMKAIDCTIDKNKVIDQIELIKK